MFVLHNSCVSITFALFCVSISFCQVSSAQVFIHIYLFKDVDIDIMTEQRGNIFMFLFVSDGCCNIRRH